MSKTIEQLRAEAALIEDAVRQGENTQVRVGGLFQDIIDFIAQIPITETVLGPLLQALNNSELINPGDGQTLTFSLMKEGWTFSDALTQLQIRLGQISSTVTSNYEAFLQAKNLLQAEVAATDERVRNYKTEYDQSQLEYATWKSQTDTSISQYAVAIDRNTRNIVSISGRVDTAFDQLDFVTNNLEAADIALGKLFNLTGLDYEDPEQAYTASWLYKNRQGIYGAAATFDENGNIIEGSTLSLTVRGLESKVFNTEQQVSLIKQSVDNIQLAVAGNEQHLGALEDIVNGTSGNPGLAARLGAVEGKAENSASWINQRSNKIDLVVGEFDDQGRPTSSSGLVTTSTFSGLFTEAYDETGAATTMAQMNVELVKKLDENGVERVISKAKIQADQIEMNSKNWNAWVDEFGVSASHISMDAVTFDLWASDYLQLTADDISFNFREKVEFVARGYNFTAHVLTLNPDGTTVIRNKSDIEVLRVDSNGDLTISGNFYGNLTGGRITNNLEIGSGTKKMRIEPVGDYGARLVGLDGDFQSLVLGFDKYDGEDTSSLFLSAKASNNQDTLIRIQSGYDFADISAMSAGNTREYHVVRMIAYPRYGYATFNSNAWPRSASTSNLDTGSVYVDADGFLKAKGY